MLVETYNLEGIIVQGLEIRIGEIPIPLINYVLLIINRESPYYEIVRHVAKEMEFHYQQTGKSEIVYTINPRILIDEIESKVKSSKNLTKVNVCRTILALRYLCKLKEEDFWVTTTSSGRKNYHFRVNQNLLNSLRII